MTDTLNPNDFPERPFRCRLFYTTPMRDLVRARVTGRLDLTLYPERAGLAEPLSTLVVRVCKKSRLRMIEKADVARELSAHFAEGLAAGKTAEKLIEEFGDVKHAARLIRRAKKRSRSHIARAVKQATVGTLAAVALVYGVILVWYLVSSGSANPSHDYLAQMNTVAAAVPEADRAWPRYRDIYLSLGEIPDNVGGCEGRADYRWPETKAYLQSRKIEIAAFRACAMMPGMGYIMATSFHDEDLVLFDPDRPVADHKTDPGESVPAIGALLPQLGRLMGTANLLRLNAFMQIESGSTDTAIDDIEAITGAARHADEHPTYISQLVRLRILNNAIEIAKSMLDSPEIQLTEAQLRRLDRLFAPAIDNDLCTIDINVERLLHRDIEQHAFTDNGNGNGRFRPSMAAYLDMFDSTGNPPLLVAAPYSAALPDRKTYRAQIDQIFDLAVAQGQTPMWERDIGGAQELIERVEAHPWSSFRWSIAISLMPAFDRLITRADIVAMERDALRVAIALHRYKLRVGQWPSTLAELVPTDLDLIPPDRFDGKPLRYQIDQDGQPMLYSVGTNYRDDDGTLRHDEDGWPTNGDTKHWRPRSSMAVTVPLEEIHESSPHHPEFKGDFILWPPLPEKPVEEVVEQWYD